MKRTMWTLAVAAIVVAASFGIASACGEAKAEPALAKADTAKAGCCKDHANMANGEKAGCAHAVAAADKAEVAAVDAAMPDCAKGAMVAKTNGAVEAVGIEAVAVEAAAGKPCAGASGCARKAKAAEVAKAKDAKEPVEVAKNAK